MPYLSTADRTNARAERIMAPRERIVPPPTRGQHVACHDCDRLYWIEGIPEGSVAKCSRCGGVVYSRKDRTIPKTLAFAIAGLILFVPANVYPFMTMKIMGKTQASTLLHAVLSLYHEGFLMVSGLVFVCSIAAPLAQLVFLLYILLPLSTGKVPPGLAPIFRSVRSIGVWGMLEVYMLGILVSIIKLKDMATLEMGIGLYAFVALLVVVILATVTLNPREVWERLED